MSPARVQARRLWLRVHLWLGLLLGCVFVLLAASGSVLVFYNEVDRLLNPHTRAARAAARPPALAAVQQALRRAEPQRDGGWRVELPLTSEAPLAARYYQPVEREGRFFAPLMLTLDPNSLEPTSRRFWGDYAMTWLYDLHYTLLFEGSGRMVVGWLGVAMSIALLSGLILWWPAWRRLGRALLPRMRSGKVRASYDLHVLSGAYTAILLVVVCVTGTALAWPDATRAVLNAPVPVAPAAPQALATRWAMDVDDGIAQARALFPEAELRWVDLPARYNSILSVRLHQSAEPGRRFPKTQVWADLRTGTVLAVHDPLRHGTGMWLMSWLHPLHNGEAFGLVGRLLVAICGLAPVLLFITGWLRWRQKQRARRLAVLRLRWSASVAQSGPAR